MPGERKPQHANDFNKADLLQLLLALQGKVNRELHVGTLCVIDSQVDEHTFRGFAFPKMQDRDAATFNLICIRSSDFELIKSKLEHHPICVAMMTDLDSEANYNKILIDKSYKAIDNTSTMHSFNNAVIVYVGDCVDGTKIDEEEEE